MSAFTKNNIRYCLICHRVQVLLKSIKEPFHVKGGLHVTFGHFYFVTQLLNEFIKVHKSIHFQKREFHEKHISNVKF